MEAEVAVITANMKLEATVINADMELRAIAAANVKAESAAAAAKMELEAITAANVDALPLTCRQMPLLPIIDAEPGVADVETCTASTETEAIATTNITHVKAAVTANNNVEAKAAADANVEEDITVTTTYIEL